MSQLAVKPPPARDVITHELQIFELVLSSSQLLVTCKVEAGDFHTQRLRFGVPDTAENRERYALGATLKLDIY